MPSFCSQSMTTILPLKQPSEEGKRCILVHHLAIKSTFMWGWNEQVVMLVLEVQACIAQDPQHFHRLMVFLVHRFNSEHSLLEKYTPFSSNSPSKNEFFFPTLLMLVLIRIILNTSLICDKQERSIGSAMAVHTAGLWASVSRACCHLGRGGWLGVCYNHGPGSFSWELPSVCMWVKLVAVNCGRGWCRVHWPLIMLAIKFL